MMSSTSMAARTGARQLLRRSASVAPPSPSPIVLGRNHSINNARNLSTARPLAVPSARLRTPSTPVRQQRQGYATTTNPNPPLDKKNASNDVPSRIALIGARGYTGQALIDLFEAHPYMDLRHVSSRELAGKELERYTKRKVIYEHLTPEDAAQLDAKGEIDCWVMALPNGVCKPYVDAINESQKGKTGGSVIVDLSADYRFDKGVGLRTARAHQALRHLPVYPHLQPRMLRHGRPSSALRLWSSTSPGSLSSLAFRATRAPGTKPSPKNDVNLLKDNLIPYSLTGHVHEREISHHLGTSVAFIPHVASWFRSIHLTINITLNKTMTSRDIRQLYQDRYAGEKLVKVVGEAPLVRSVSSLHHCEIGGFAVDNTGKRVVICVSMDNLNKGAATQCLQNMNLALGYAEYQGIPNV
ncbi:arg-6 [Verticillium alfalfae VaMs.102]|uniref:Arg-6 n=1 Tax=Verticillium alfalfae (strain VaMs.102 / ATCC MYA-4576 / FGSC 10136) TaxID=526221 RepID=C9STK2_VERA1|nr:arg-6 [Verticillium alfalfae VaMs.102]EEY22163.1 arg-6 [Verticillium alfalfae VaMs.102]